jgi:hypothetical protein
MNIAQIELNKLNKANAELRKANAVLGKDLAVKDNALAAKDSIIAEYQRRYGVLKDKN